MNSDLLNECSTFTLEQRAILILWQRVNTSLSAFYKLKKHFGSAQSALQQGESKWTTLGIHAKHIARHRKASTETDEDFIADIEKRRAGNEFQVLFQEDSDYPQQLLQLFNPPPLLFYRGNGSLLNAAQIAIVGSRKPTQKAQKLTFDMAQYLAKTGYIITSGLAQGVDAQAHLGALAQNSEQSGRTIGVMGTGIDVYYPVPHRALFERIINEGGCIISELLPGIKPNKHTFPRRNRIVAGLSLGTIVTEAAIKSGSLITARLTSEQGKQVFALPSSIDNSNAEGCHHLIREGATLVYHPEQIIEDLCSQLLAPGSFTKHEEQLKQEGIDLLNNKDEQSDYKKTKSETLSLFNQSSFTAFASNDNAKPVLKEKKSATISKHLQPLWVHIEFDSQDLDALIIKTKLDTPSLLSQLMELELLGVITQVGGRYQRLTN
ncbi:DNA-processing protein DprA [Psychrobacter sanguinis]|nr:DNA-processing protein DprA [Psychrobacter sanguinis]MDY3305939.1 DNA-processing protein DprA [Psychrobacter sanguinis]